MKIIFLGDVVGKAGRRALHKYLPALKVKHNADFVIANGENASGGVREPTIRDQPGLGSQCRPVACATPPPGVPSGPRGRPRPGPLGFDARAR